MLVKTIEPLHIHILLTNMFFLLILIITTFFPQPSHSQAPPPQQLDYSICKEKFYNCGNNITDISYPFWGKDRPPHCGGGDLFKLTCNNNDKTTAISIGTQNFKVMAINATNSTIQMQRTDSVDDVCSPDFEDINLIPNLFQFPSTVQNMSIFFDCPFGIGYPELCGNAICYAGSQSQLLEENGSELKRCGRSIQVPTDRRLMVGVYDIVSVGELERGLKAGFGVKYNVNEKCVRCLGRDGDCGTAGSNDDIDEFAKSSCYYDYNCPDGSIATSNKNCSNHKKKNSTQYQEEKHPFLQPYHSTRRWAWIRKITLGILGAATILFMGIIMCCCFSCKISTRRINLWFMGNNHDQVIEAFLKSHGALLQKRYKFSEVKKMTNSFKTKLGQGGFGAVYKGKLPNNSPIAVKILKASKGDGEDFINEVASISRTSHVNVVTLLGFCFERRKKALIYEFMPNGSLDNFICNKGPRNISSLSWEKLFQIAKGIARGLEYLHKGCNTRILHFDIKPHNILLDENFCPKISDFGLAKVCPRKESVISMSNLRGTMGYIAPELWNRQFGGVSHKSDVYSYGMMLLEMVGVRSNINSEADQTSEYFPDWIYRKLESGGDLRHDGVIDTEENEIARGMTIVGLWCIQVFPNDRPAMGKVVEMLETNMNSLDMPPKPMISSPIRSIPESSTS